MILHFSHIGLTDGLTFMLVRSLGGKTMSLILIPALATAADRRYRVEEAPRDVTGRAAGAPARS
jgi:hypothetical protein